MIVSPALNWNERSVVFFKFLWFFVSKTRFLPMFHPFFYFEAYFLIDIHLSLNYHWIFCYFCSKTSFFKFKNDVFQQFWANLFFHQKYFFTIILHYFFWFFKLSTISLGQLSTFLSIFLWFLPQMTRFSKFFYPKKSFFEKQIRNSFWLISTDF